MRALASVAVVLLMSASAACADVRDAAGGASTAMTDGDPARGRVLLRTYGCETCHTIPGVVGADARVGPPLAGIADRSYIAGVLTNAPDNMMRWILDPPSVDSLTAMPNVGVTRADARHIAAYLYTLR
jgi:cytochrome c